MKARVGLARFVRWVQPLALLGLSLLIGVMICTAVSG